MTGGLIVFSLTILWNLLVWPAIEELQLKLENIRISEETARRIGKAKPYILPIIAMAGVFCLFLRFFGVLH